MTWFKAGLLAPFGLAYEIGQEASRFIQTHSGVDAPWQFTAGFMISMGFCVWLLFLTLTARMRD